MSRRLTAILWELKVKVAVVCAEAIDCRTVELPYTIRDVNVCYSYSSASITFHFGKGVAM